MSRTHGPTATTTWSQETVPWSVTTALTRSPSPSKPVTDTPVSIRTPASRTMPASPLSDSVLFAYPPRFSCSRIEIPGACQSEKMSRM